MDNWNVDQVIDWLKLSGYGSHERRFREHGITGDLLVHADHNMLKELDVSSVGQRINMLRAIYNLKLSQGIPFDQEDFVPETASWGAVTNKEQEPFANNVKSRHDSEDYARLKILVKQQDHAINRLTKDVEFLSAELAKIKENLRPVWAMVKEYEEFEQKKKSGRVDGKKSIRLPSKPTKPPSARTPSPSKSTSSPDSAGSAGIPTRLRADKPNVVSAMRIYTDSKLNRENEPYKTVQVSIEDTCAEILPEVLRKYKIRTDWQHYALFMRHKGTERCLSFDEKPFALLQQLQDEHDTPAFTLKHIKQVVSPASRLSENPSSSAGAKMITETVQLNGLESNRDLPSAVAVYEYQATLADELDVAIGDRFKIVRKERGWCVVEKDGRLGWVPQGCLAHSTNDLLAAQESTIASQKGLALFDYTKISPNELSIKKGDQLVVRNKYEHWLLAECKGESGWVPTCYVSILDGTGADDGSWVARNADRNADKGELERANQKSPRGMQEGRTLRRSMSTEDWALADKTKTRSRSNTVATGESPGRQSTAVGSGSDRLTSVLQDLSSILQAFQKDDEEQERCLELVDIIANHKTAVEANPKFGTIVELVEAGKQSIQKTLAETDGEDELPKRKASIENAYTALNTAVNLLMGPAK